MKLLFKRSRKLISILLLFFISFNISYFSFSFLREMQFKIGLESDCNTNNLKLKETQQLLNNRYMNINFNNKEERWEFEGANIQYYYYYYLVLSEKYISNNGKVNLLFKLPELYGKIHALMSMTYILIAAGDSSLIDLTKSEFYIKKWLRNGEKQEGDWWKRFKESQEYKDFISEIVIDRKSEKGETIYQVYEGIVNRKTIDNSSILNNIFNYWVINLEKEIADEAYRNYEEHINNNDYVAAVMDIDIILGISIDMNRIRNLNLESYLYIDPHHLPRLDFIATQLISDIIYIFILSCTLTLILYFIVKKWSERKALKNI